MNDQLITNACHDTALYILRNSGNHVTLLVKHYKAAAPFLLGPRGIYKSFSRSIYVQNVINRY